MAEIHEVIYTRATTHAGLSALISYGSGLYAFYPLVLPRNANLPAVVYQVLDAPRVRTHTSGPSQLTRPRIQMACWGKTYVQSKSVSRQLRLAFDGWVDKSAGLRVDVAMQDNNFDDFEETTELWRSLVDVIIYHADEIS